MKLEAIFKRWILKPQDARDLCLLDQNYYSFLIDKDERASIKKAINNRLKYLSFSKHFQHNDGVPRCGLNALTKQGLFLIVQVTGEDFRKETNVFQHQCLYLMKHKRLMIELNHKYYWYYGNMSLYGVYKKHPDEYKAFNDGIKDVLRQLKQLTEQDNNPDDIYAGIVEQSKAINTEISKAVSLFNQAGKFIGF